MSVRAWSMENEISKKTYYYWQKRLYQQMISTAETVRFAEISYREETPPNPSVTAKMSLSEATVEVYPGADTQMIQTLLQTPRSC